MKVIQTIRQLVIKVVKQKMEAVLAMVAIVVTMEIFTVMEVPINHFDENLKKNRNYCDRK